MDDKPFAVGGRTFPRAAGPYVLGVINRSPESRTERAYAADVDAALRRAEALASEGADIIDIGGQSTHFSAPLVPIAEEIARLVPTVRALKREGHLVSVETWRAPVAQVCLDVDADMVNDTGGLQDPAMFDLIASAGVPVMVMYLEGRSPRDARPLVWSADFLGRLHAFFASHLAKAAASGIEHLLCDVGTGIEVAGETEDARAAFRDRLYRALPAMPALPAPLAIQLHLCHDEARDQVMIRYLAEKAHMLFFRAHDVEPIARYRRSLE